MNVSMLDKDISEIEIIKPLWEKLNAIHLDKSIFFKSKYEKFTFEKRIESFNKETGKVIKIAVLFDSEKEKYIGYCISSIEEKQGEIESIFIEKEYRKFGLGDKLMSNALMWFHENSIKDIQIGVVYANDDVLPFYQKYGFNISSYVLKRSLL